MKLWYKEPAVKWTDSLPLGNGRIGAMVFGGVGAELISLNEDTLWSGYPRNTIIKDGPEQYQQIKALMKKKAINEASEHIEDYFLSDFSESYMPFGDLTLAFPTLKDRNITDYLRELCLDTAIASVKFNDGKVSHHREYFVSQPDQALIIALTASHPGEISFDMTMVSQLHSETSVVGKSVEISGIAPSHVEPSYVEDCQEPIVYDEEDQKKGITFYGKAEVNATGGRVKQVGHALQVVGADSVIIKVYLRTSFNGFDRQPYVDGQDCKELVYQDQMRLDNQDYTVIKASHISDYQAYYHRVDLSFNDTSEDIPTDQRLIAFKEHRNDPFLYELLFNYGRYLTIAGSRAGTQATNLQGIWNKDLRPIWSSNFTININTEMNYWGAEAGNLSELHSPLFDFIDVLTVTGQETASKYYDAKGCTSHHNSDIWGLSTPVGGKGWRGLAGVCFWNMSYGWLTRHLFEHYEYTLDRAFLADKAYPAIRLAAEYYLDLLEENEDGYLWLTPTSSPENKYEFEGHYYNVSEHATMTGAIIKEVLCNAIKCCQLLQLDEDFKVLLETTVEKLFPYEIGSKGQLLEWDKEYGEEQPQHRHISHMYPLYPSNEINEEKAPKLFEACKKSLELRGDSGTGWSLGWKINAWARLKDGDRALELLKNQLKLVEGDDVNYMDGGGSYINLFDAHPPFQIDGNYGAYAGICEMLLQSYDDTVIILPALPSELKTGYVKGLRAKNGLEVSIEFDDGHLTSVQLVSRVNKPVQVLIVYGENDIRQTFDSFETIQLNKSDFNNQVE